MGNENKKDFNFMMNNNKDMPKIQVIKDEKKCWKTSMKQQACRQEYQ